MEISAHRSRGWPSPIYAFQRISDHNFKFALEIKDLKKHGWMSCVLFFVYLFENDSMLLLPRDRRLNNTWCFFPFVSFFSSSFFLCTSFDESGGAAAFFCIFSNQTTPLSALCELRRVFRFYWIQQEAHWLFHTLAVMSRKEIV